MICANGFKSIIFRITSRSVRSLFRLFPSGTYKPEFLQVRSLRYNLDIPKKDPKKIHPVPSVLHVVILQLVTQFLRVELVCFLHNINNPTINYHFLLLLSVLCRYRDTYHHRLFYMVFIIHYDLIWVMSIHFYIENLCRN